MISKNGLRLSHWTIAFVRSRRGSKKKVIGKIPTLPYTSIVYILYIARYIYSPFCPVLYCVYLVYCEVYILYILPCVFCVCSVYCEVYILYILPSVCYYYGLGGGGGRRGGSGWLEKGGTGLERGPQNLYSKGTVSILTVLVGTFKIC
jgi:hypothetical protein